MTRSHNQILGRYSFFFAVVTCLFVLQGCGDDQDNSRVNSDKSPEEILRRFAQEEKKKKQEKAAQSQSSASVESQTKPSNTSIQSPELRLSTESKGSTATSETILQKVAAILSKDMNDPGLVNSLTALYQVVEGSRLRSEMEADSFSPKINLGIYEFSAVKIVVGSEVRRSFLWPKVRISGVAYRMGASSDPTLKDLNKKTVDAFCRWLGFESSTENYKIQSDRYYASVPEKDRAVGSIPYPYMPRFFYIYPLHHLPDTDRYLTYIDWVECSGRRENIFSNVFDVKIAGELEKLNLVQTSFLGDVRKLIQLRVEKSLGDTRNLDKLITMNDDSSVSILSPRVMVDGALLPINAKEATYSAVCKTLGFRQSHGPTSDEEPVNSADIEVADYRNGIFVASFGKPGRAIRCSGD